MINSSSMSFFVRTTSGRYQRIRCKVDVPCCQHVVGIKNFEKIEAQPDCEHIGHDVLTCFPVGLFIIVKLYQTDSSK